MLPAQQDDTPTTPLPDLNPNTNPNPSPNFSSGPSSWMCLNDGNGNGRMINNSRSISRSAELFLQISNTQELVSHIVSFIDRWELSCYVTVSRGWQYVVERQTFRQIAINYTDLKLFTQMYAPAHRKEALARLQYEISFPKEQEFVPVEVAPGVQVYYENADSSGANKPNQLNIVRFSDAIHELFALLKSWEDSFLAAHPHRQSRTLTLDLRISSSPTGDHMRIQQQAFGRIRLEGSDTLPILSRVTGFCSSWDWGGRCGIVESQSIIRIMSRFPSLRDASLSLRSRSIDNAELKQRICSGKSTQVLHKNTNDETTSRFSYLSCTYS